MAEVIVPNRAVSQTVIASSPINENWETIQEALNTNRELAESAYTEASEKIDTTEKGVESGVATLDEQGKLTIDQLPDSALGQVFRVSSVNEQLLLDANRGDICVRTDTSKTYGLSGTDPTHFDNWIEIATLNSANEIEGNQPYNNIVQEDDWELDNSSNLYYIQYDNDEHGQGTTNFLLVVFNASTGEHINIDYTIDEGNITIYSTLPLSGSITISNLQGNSKNNLLVPYSVYSANFTNEVQDIFDITNGLNLVTDPEITLVDGFGFVKTINQCTSLDVSSYNGYYYAFIDSSNLNGSTLSNLTLVEASNYLGVQDHVPQIGTEGQRCYVAFDGSYEYQDAWVRKSFTVIGIINIENGTIISTYTLPYNTNNINTTYKSIDKDYLFGNEIQGLNVGQSNSYISISSGKCLDSTQSIILNCSSFYKTMEAWQQGTYTGGLITDDEPSLTNIIYEVNNGTNTGYTSESGVEGSYASEGITIYTTIDLTTEIGIAEENEYTYTGNTSTVTFTEDSYVFYYVYVIKNYLNEVDVCISRSTTPNLPNGFIYYRRICTLLGYNTEIPSFNQYKKDILLTSPISLLNKELSEKSTIDFEFSTTLSKLKFLVQTDAEQSLTFTNNSQILEIKQGTYYTMDIYNTELTVQSNGTSTINISLLGFTDDGEY